MSEIPAIPSSSKPIYDTDKKVNQRDWYDWQNAIDRAARTEQRRVRLTSVNGVEMDENGSITLTPDDVGAETIGLHQGTVEITANTTITAEHIGKVLRCTSAVTLTIDTKANEDIDNRAWLIVHNDSSGLVTLAEESGVTLNAFEDLRDISEKASCGLWKMDDDLWAAQGSFE